jgi:hypothetical protein
VATFAFPSDLVLEKLYPPPTLWALSFKDIPWFPVSPILTRAFHIPSSLNINIKYSTTIFLDLRQNSEVYGFVGSIGFIEFIGFIELSGFVRLHKKPNFVTSMTLCPPLKGPRTANGPIIMMNDLFF